MTVLCSVTRWGVLAQLPALFCGPACTPEQLVTFFGALPETVVRALPSVDVADGDEVTSS